MKKLLIALAAMCCLASCKDSKPLLPNVSGKAGEVLVVIEKVDWDGPLGESVRGVLADEYPFLPVVEANYSVSNVAHGGFIDMFKVHRNIVYFDINTAGRLGVKYLHDKWAAPQCVIQISASCPEQADSLFKASSAGIVAAIEQAERDRVIANTLKYENRNCYPTVAAIFGGAPHIPSGFKLLKKTDDFVWISDQKQYTIQGIFVYKYPAEGNDFETANIIRHRNEIMKANVPGMIEGSYMTTGTYWEPRTSFIKYRGREFAETHGMWDVEGDFMGGPFVSHAFYSKDGKDIIVCEAWVYAARFDKRQYLRQTESILYSWEWKEK